MLRDRTVSCRKPCGTSFRPQTDSARGSVSNLQQREIKRLSSHIGSARQAGPSTGIGSVGLWRLGGRQGCEGLLDGHRSDSFAQELRLAPLSARKGSWSLGVAALLAAMQASNLTACAQRGVIRRPRLAVNRALPKRWLRSGPQARITPKIRALALHLRASSPIQTMRNIHRWVTSHTRRYKGNRTEVLRRRTSDELLEDRTLSGCGDWGILLTALFRAAGIPTIYVEAIDWHWARKWMDGSDEGPHLGHVFLEVYVQGTWRLVDSTRGWIWSSYDPDEPSLPLHYYAFAKGLDAWSLGIRNFASLMRSLEHIAEYLDSKKIRGVSYPRGFLTPTVLLLANEKVIAQRHRIHRSIYFTHHSTGSLTRLPESSQLDGIDALVSIVAGKPAPVRVAQYLGLNDRDLRRIEGVVASCKGRHRCRRVLFIDSATGRICLAVTASSAALLPFLHSLLDVRPDQERAISAQSCRIHHSRTKRQVGPNRPSDPRPASGSSAQTDDAGKSHGKIPSTKPPTKPVQEPPKAPRHTASRSGARPPGPR